MSARGEVDPAWRLHIKHTCHTETLKFHAMEKLRGFQENPAGATIKHESAAGIEVVTVEWMGARFMIVLGFHPGIVMASMKVPAAFKMWRSSIQDTVKQHIQGVIAAAGGELLELTDGAGNAL